jgi:nucleoside-diphosphate-sugar epimerase
MTGAGRLDRRDQRDPASVLVGRAKARARLNWSPLFTTDNGLARTIRWYREFLS